MKRVMFAILFIFFMPAMSWALATTMEFGVRGAVGEVGLDEDYTAAEVYLQKALPWSKEISPGMMVCLRLDAGASYLKADAEKSGWVAIGGDVVLSMLDGTWEVEGGWRPTILFEDEFGSDDFGGPIQFSSHVGTTFYLGDVALNYRFVHISNAGIYDENPGLDLHMVGVGMRF